MKRFIILLILVIPLGAMGIILRTMVVEPGQPSRLDTVPLRIGDWQAEELSISEGTAASLRSTETLLRSYRHPNGDYIGLFIAYFRDQKYGSQIHSPRHCLPGGGWVVSSLTEIPFAVGTHEIMVNRMTITKRSSVDQMFYWYQSRSGDLTSEYSLKFDLVKNSLFLSPTDAALIRLTIPQGNRTVEQCQQVVEQFVAACILDIEQALPFKKL